MREFNSSMLSGGLSANAAGVITRGRTCVLLLLVVLVSAKAHTKNLTEDLAESLEADPGISSNNGLQEPVTGDTSLTKPNFPDAARTYVSDEEFRSDSSLVALPKQVSVFRLKSSSTPTEGHVGGGELSENVTRYQLGGGAYSFCLEKADAALRALTVRDEKAHTFLTLHRGDCKQLVLPSGRYKISLWHDAKAVGGAASLAFLQMQTRVVSVLDRIGVPKSGFWNFAADPALDPLGQRRPSTISVGNRICVNGSGLPCNQLAANQLFADWGSQVVSGDSLFLLHLMPDEAVAYPNRYLAAYNERNYFYPQWDIPFHLYAMTGTLARDGAFSSPISVNEVGSSSFMLTANPGTGSTRLFLDSSSVVNVASTKDSAGPNLTFQLLSRVFPAKSPVALGPVELDEGEVAIFTGKNATGDGVVFASDIADLSAMSSSLFNFSDHTLSVRLGDNTAIVVYSGKKFTGMSQTLTTNMDDLTALPIGQNVASLQICPLAPVFVASGSCNGCRLENADFTGLTLNNSDLQNAQLTGASFKNSSLRSAKFQNATLAGVDFGGADLTDSWFTGDDLTGITLDAKTALYGAHLSGANLSRLSLANLDLREIDLSGAQLYGTNLNNSNLYAANMQAAILSDNPSLNINQAASLSGANLQDVNLSNAILSGADLTSANFYSSVASGTCAVNANGLTSQCATAAGATMNATKFDGAYLFGTDFTNSTIKGVDFGAAVLIGTNFSGAHLSAGLLGADSGFESAFLQGATLPLDMSGTSLNNAYLDFNPQGNVLTMLLDNSHTGFAGWHAPGNEVCVYTQYRGPTNVPANNTAITCPNGTPAGSSGCGPNDKSNSRWNNGKDIAFANPRGAYLLQPSYGQKSAQPICKSPDPQWGQP